MTTGSETNVRGQGHAQGLVQAQGLAAHRDELLALVARELRASLAPLHNGLEAVRLRNAGDEASLRVLSAMDRQVERLVHMAEDVLDLSRFALGRAKLRPRRVELADVLRGAVHATAEALDEAEHTLKLGPVPPDAVLDADPARLTHAFEALLDYAIRSSERGGRIELDARLEEGAAVVTVKDSSNGIPPAALPRLFDLDPLSRVELPLQPGGLGVGLVVVKNLVELHGGTVQALSEGAGRGSEFVVRLPLARASRMAAATPAALPSELLSPDDVAAVAAAARASVAPGAATSTSRGLRVVIVDDNSDAADTLAVLLGSLGQEVRTAYDGPTALELVPSFRPALVLLDLMMPGMDGFEVARRLRARDDLKSMALVALTALNREADRRNSWAAGFDSHLVKPVDVGVLRAMLYSLAGDAAR